MSRLSKLKKNRKKHIIKTTMASLTLIMAVGATQVMGTYALFTDMEKIIDKLTVSTGDIDVEVGEGIYRETLNDKKAITKKFQISNKGTLNQHLKINFIKGKLNTLEDEYLKYIDYKLDIKTSKGKQVIIKPISNSNNLFNLFNEDGSILKLGNDDYLECNLSIKLKSDLTSEQKRLISEKNINFDLVILASQLNYKNEKIVFEDKDNQINLIYIDKLTNCENIKPNLSVEFDDNKTEIEINIPKEYQEKNLNLINVNILEGKGAFENAQLEVENGNPDIEKDEFDIVGFDKSKIESCFSENHKLKVELTFKNIKTEEILKETWEIKFRVVKDDKGKEKLEAHYIKLSEYKDTVINKEITEQLVVDEVAPNEPEVIRPTKEEIVIPDQPDIKEQVQEEIEIQE